jgi:hypothetical protein
MIDFWQKCQIIGYIVTLSLTLASAAIERVPSVGKKSCFMIVQTISEMVDMILVCGCDQWQQNNIKFERFSPTFSAVD